MTATEHEIRITIRDVYDVQQKQIATMAAMSSKLDLYIGLNTEKEKAVVDHENRIRSMERKVYALPGVASLIAIAGLLVAIFKK